MKSKVRFRKQIVCILIAVYVALAVFVAVANRSGNALLFGKIPFFGVITAMQFLLAIAMTLMEDRFGGIAAHILLAYSTVTIFITVAHSGNVGALPGLCFLIAANLAIGLIRHGIHRAKVLSYQDSLTGLHNRRSMMELLDDYVARKTPFYLLYMDIDHFKYLNDVQGHEKGDQVLKEVTAIWNTVDNRHGALGRIGGDEFLCLIPRDEQFEVEEIAKQYVESLSTWRDTSDKYSRFFLSASVGIVAFPEDGNQTQDILRKADIAMYNAKKDGRNKYCRYTAWFDRAFLREQNVEVIIREAFRNDKFYMVYQPQFETNQKKLRGFEALIRLDNGNGEKVGPGEFIPVAEKSSLIVDIGEFVLKSAMADFASVMRTYSDLILSINISAKQILAPNFIEVVQKCLEQTNFPANCLEIEITEYCLMDATEEAIAVINCLKNLGVHISMDDFGTGYSSLSYLTQLPIDLIKIDKTLIDTINDSEIVPAIISVGHTIGCELIAEGVEEEAQLELLRQQGCDYVQGFIWGKPNRFVKALELIEADKQEVEVQEVIEKLH